MSCSAPTTTARSARSSPRALGAAIEPQLVVDPRDRAVRMLPLGSRIPPRTLVLAWHRDRYRSQAAGAFVQLAQELAQA